MKPHALLVVTSLLSILLLTLHITDDIVRGILKAESSNTALLVLTVFLSGTLVLAERRSGHVIMLLVGLFAALMPVLHMGGTHYPEIAKSAGGFFFVWTLWALGGLGGFTVERSRSNRMKARVSLFSDVPTTFYQDEMIRMNRFIAADHPLLIALDAEFGKQMNVPVGDGWTFRMPTGPFRLAIRHEATLIPCVLLDEGAWHFRLTFGLPVRMSTSLSSCDLQSEEDVNVALEL